MRIASVKTMATRFHPGEPRVTQNAVERSILKVLGTAKGPIAPAVLVAEVRALAKVSEAEVRAAAEDLLDRGCIVITDDWKLAVFPDAEHVIA